MAVGGDGGRRSADPRPGPEPAVPGRGPGRGGPPGPGAGHGGPGAPAGGGGAVQPAGDHGVAAAGGLVGLGGEEPALPPPPGSAERCGGHAPGPVRTPVGARGGGPRHGDLRPGRPPGGRTAGRGHLHHGAGRGHPHTERRGLAGGRGPVGVRIEGHGRQRGGHGRGHGRAQRPHPEEGPALPRTVRSPGHDGGGGQGHGRRPVRGERGTDPAGRGGGVADGGAAAGGGGGPAEVGT